MKIAVTGGTGFIGQALTSHLHSCGHDVIILTRRSLDNDNKNNVRYVQWLTDGAKPEKELEDVEAFINLAGATINARWTSSHKQRIFASRMEVTKEVLRVIKNMNRPPHTLVNASAIGYYGTSLSDVYTEESGYRGGDFLSEVVRNWEKTAEEAKALGVRTIFARFGIVLGHSGALPKMVLPYKLWTGGTVGSGKQWVSWIHIHDLTRMLTFALENPNVCGALNTTAPQPVRMKEFGKTIGMVLGRPHWLPVPAFALKLVLGEMSMLLLEGQKVFPEKASSEGFTFEYPQLENALENLL